MFDIRSIPRSISSRRRKFGRATRGEMAIRIIIGLIAIAFVVPMYLLVVISLKTPTQVAEGPFTIPLRPHWSNYRQVWEKSSGSGTASFPQAIVNSLMITGVSTALLIVIAAMAGYVLGRRTSRWSTAVYLTFMAGISIPMQLVVIPLYTALNALGLVGSPIGAIMLYVGLLTPFSVFLFTGFVRAMPRDFEEAAAIDGAGWISIFGRIVLPLLAPIVSTVAVLDAIAVWNDFFGQLILLNGSGNETLPVTVFSFAGQYVSRYDLLSAGLVLAILPILVFYLILQRRIISGFSSGLKG